MLSALWGHIRSKALIPWAVSALVCLLSLPALPPFPPSLLGSRKLERGQGGHGLEPGGALGQEPKEGKAVPRVHTGPQRPDLRGVLPSYSPTLLSVTVVRSRMGQWFSRFLVSGPLCSLNSCRGHRTAFLQYLLY